MASVLIENRALYPWQLAVSTALRMNNALVHPLPNNPSQHYDVSVQPTYIQTLMGQHRAKYKGFLATTWRDPCLK